MFLKRLMTMFQTPKKVGMREAVAVKTPTVVKGDYGVHKCSGCEHEFSYWALDTNVPPHNQEPPKFCPNCGAGSKG